MNTRYENIIFHANNICDFEMHSEGNFSLLDDIKYILHQRTSDCPLHIMLHRKFA
jgi:hypothetical protein